MERLTNHSLLLLLLLLFIWFAVVQAPWELYGCDVVVTLSGLTRYLVWPGAVPGHTPPPAAPDSDCRSETYCISGFRPCYRDGISGPGFRGRAAARLFI